MSQWINFVYRPKDGFELAANPGATGKYSRFSPDTGMVHVIWDRTNPLCSIQMDGVYHPHHFQVIDREMAYEIFMSDVQAAYKRLEELLNGTRTSSTTEI